MLTTNLSSDHAGDQSKLPADQLAAGLPHVMDLLRLCRPRVVVALTDLVYDLLLVYLKVTALGNRITPDDRHRITAAGKEYHPRSCWLDVDGVGKFLLVSLPQHPSRAASLGRLYKRSVGAYLGRRFRDALQEADAESNIHLPQAV